jgi:glycosyltransferase involved in cell wall biosynthesis
MTASTQQTISIALCTYNGSIYLPAQWQSILEQDQLPDEVVICDDQSTDRTVELLHQFAAQSPFPVRIIQNSVRLGYNKNFEKALSSCTGDLIFICDQDDYWFPEKISTMSTYMINHPQTKLAFCDAWVTDEQLEEREGRFWERVRFDSHAKTRWQTGDMMEVMLDGNRVMGCASVIRKDFLGVVLPIPDSIPGYIYDGWMGLVGAACNAIQFVDQPLQLYRTHVQQQVGVREAEPQKRVRLRDRFIRHRAIKLAPLRQKQAQLAVISRLLAQRVSDNAPGLPLLYRRLDHFTMRSCLPHDRIRRIKPVLSNLRRGNYKRYADVAANWMAPYLAALGDMLE